MPAKVWRRLAAANKENDGWPGVMLFAGLLFGLVFGAPFKIANEPLFGLALGAVVAIVSGLVIEFRFGFLAGATSTLSLVGTISLIAWL